MISYSQLPKITFVIPLLNDAKRLKSCLSSIRNQDYPQDKIEIIIMDGGSRDNTVEVARSFGAKIIINSKYDVYQRLARGFRSAKGEFVYQIDADVEMRGDNFLQKMIHPLLVNPFLVGSFTRYYPNSTQSWISRFLSYDPALLDPIYQYFSPSVDRFIIDRKNNYYVCDYSSGIIPPFTMMLYRLKFLKQNPLWNADRFFDHETVMSMVESGYTKYAYVPLAGLYHDHADNLLHLLKKRVRNLKEHYLITNSRYKYRWFDTSSFSGILKIVAWVIYANLFIPEMVRGIIKTIKFKDIVFLAQPLIAISITDVLVFNFLTLPQGRRFLKKSFSWILK